MPSQRYCIEYSYCTEYELVLDLARVWGMGAHTSADPQIGITTHITYNYLKQALTDADGRASSYKNEKPENGNLYQSLAELRTGLYM